MHAGQTLRAIADVIVPSPAYTEQDGLYSNLEGRVQECRKASYPTGQALEDWKIFNLILKELNQSIIFKDSKSLRTEIYNLLPNFSSIGMLPKKVAIKHKKKETNFNDPKIKINKVRYTRVLNSNLVKSLLAFICGVGVK